ncbi:CLUMA_CG014400, isoform A [Clunio marinus]|uniref:CLUMA_CG014400, isoform A n=1 Tax=Clunio marinus TaxID=568069 RepID=A0A1J1IME9_9DIPT|nr:CLUMA_CG014400, isoform A [Clunio marinus]
MIKSLVLLLVCTLVQSQTIGPGVPDSRCPPGTPNPPLHLSHPYFCDVFFTCVGGLAFPQRCPYGQHFSVQKSRCDWPEVANCGGSSPPGICPPGDPRPPVFLPHEYDCGRFYQCVWGEPMEINCPPGMHWNIIDSVCDWPERANCNLTTTRYWTTTSRRTTSTRRRSV